MARNYSVSGSNITNTVNTTRIGLTSAATIRPRIYDILVGSQGTAGDNVAEYQLKRYTAAGTSTAATAYPLDSSDPASLLAATTGITHTAEPTYSGAILLEFGVNQRVTFRFVAKDGKELVLPATAANGAGLFVSAVTTAWAANFTIHEEE